MARALPSGALHRPGTSGLAAVVRTLALLLVLAVGGAALPGAALAQEGAWQKAMIAATKSLKQHDYAASGAHLQAALAIAERFGTADPRLGRTLSNLAYIYRLEGLLTQAEPLYRRTLAMWESMLGPHHLDVATALNNLAGLHFLQGRYDEAEVEFLRSLAIREKTLGGRHPDVATSLYYLARLYRAQNRLDEAEAVLERSVTIWQSILGPAHIKVATSLYDLARLYRAQGRFDEAERIESRIRAIWAYGARRPPPGE